jgi:multidrug efflux pump subunit AcrA (membrane-fusion protein)
VFQGHNLVASLSARENVMLVLQLRGWAVRAARQEAELLLDQVGLPGKADSLPATSPAASASASPSPAPSPAARRSSSPTNRPPPSTPRTASRSPRSCAQLAREQGRTVVVVTHDNRIFHLADRILHIEDGRMRPAEGADHESEAAAPLRARRPASPSSPSRRPPRLHPPLRPRRPADRSRTTAPRTDIAGAAKEVPPKGKDERVPLPQISGVAGNGIVEPADRETKVAGQAPGRIAVVHVKEGDQIEAGQPLLELEAATEKASLAAAEADLAAAEADLSRTLHGRIRQDIDAADAEAEAAKARSELSKGTLERITKLAEGGAATPDELDRARRSAEAEDMSFKAADARRNAALAGSRREDVLAARARVSGAQARRDQARAILDRLTIRAPIAGEVLSVKVRAGEYYSPGAGEAVVMGDTRVLRVRMDVEERDIGKIRKGLLRLRHRRRLPRPALPRPRRRDRPPHGPQEHPHRRPRRAHRHQDPRGRHRARQTRSPHPGLRVVSVIDDKSMN